ncbi:MAG: hypothetical protein ACRD03_17270 [Acidimicrobiales bacterium]
MGVEGEPETTVVDDGDELARQRRKRAARLGPLGPSEPADADLPSLLDRCFAAIEESGGAFDLGGYLLDRGYGWATVERVLAHLDGARAPRSPHPAEAPWGRP